MTSALSACSAPSANRSIPRPGFGINEFIGGKRCPIVDTWWQTETGGILITPLPGATPTKPGSATLPFFGIVPEVVDDYGRPVPRNSGGKLVIRKPWPGMLRGLWGDPQRYQQVYWGEVEGSYFTGDGSRQDKDGYFWIVGRIDDVLNVAGHRIGTAEVESALVSHQKVAEAAVVGRPDAMKGQALVAFVTVKTGVHADAALREELRLHVAKEIGPVAKPDDIRFAESLPKTRSGKIMRRLLKQIAAGHRDQRRHHYARRPRGARAAHPGRGVRPARHSKPHNSQANEGHMYGVPALAGQTRLRHGSPSVSSRFQGAAPCRLKPGLHTPHQAHVCYRTVHSLVSV